MKRVLSVLLLMAVLLFGVVAQEAILPKPPGEIESFLELLDAIDAMQIVVLDAPERLTENDLEDLHELVSIAETAYGAEDLASRARSLIVLATLGKQEAPPELPPVEGGLRLMDDEPMARDTQVFRRWVNVGATAGASALGMAAIFHYLGERNYQAWLTTDPADSDLLNQLQRAWRGYDALGMGLGTATVLAVGVGLPLTFALTPPSATLATSPDVAIYSPAAQDAELERLYAKRVEIVRKLNRLNEREERRSFMQTISLGAGVAGAIAAGTFYYLADQTYDMYLQSVAPDSEMLGKRVAIFDGIALSTAAVGGAGLGFAATLGVVTSGRAELERDLEQVNAQIVRVRVSRTIEAPDEPEPEPEKEEDERLSWSERRDARKAARAEAEAAEAEAQE